MSLPLVGSLLLAAVAASSLAGLYLSWPRRLTAEEWVLHRRTLHAAHLPPPSQPRRRSFPTPEAWFRRPLALIEPDLALLRAFGLRAPADQAELVAALARRALLGAAVGVLVALLIWLGEGEGGLFWALLVLAACLGLLPLMSWLRLRRQAAGLRSAFDSRLPRLLTAARMLLESGAATPERALVEAVAIHDDPAARVLKEALRTREVRRVEVEEALEEAALRYRLEGLERLADGFRVGRRYGTGMAQLIAEHASQLRELEYQGYRERVSRAPILMTVPALLFFVGPLLVLIIYLVFSPLFRLLGQL